MNQNQPDAPRIGVIGLPGRWSTEVLADAVERSTGFRLVIDMAEVWLELASGQLKFGDYNISDFDGLLVKKISSEYSHHTLDRLEMLRVAEASGVRIFSPALNILRLIDRLSCTVTLRNHGLPMPPTLITENLEVAQKAIRNYGAAVLKPLYSTKARGMLVLDETTSDADLVAQLQQFQCTSPVLYVQKKLNLPGQDLGMVFLGGEYIGTYARVSQSNTWNTTIHSGGKYAPYQPSQALIELARRAQAPFAMDFTTVDVAESELGPVIFEVSAFGGFRGLQEGLSIDAAAIYVDYAVKQLAKGSF